MAFFPCKPQGAATSTTPLTIGFYRCWEQQEEPSEDTYLKYFVLPYNTKNFEIIREGE